MPEAVTVIVTDRILGPFASQAQHEAGAVSNLPTNPLGVKQAIAAQVPGLAFAGSGLTGTRSTAARVADHPDVEEWRGLAGDPSDTGMMKAAFAAGGALKVGKREYQLEDGFIATKAHSVFWETGHKLRLVAGFPSGSDVYTWKPAFGEEFIGWRTVGGPNIQPDVDGLGRDGFRIDHTAHAGVSNSAAVIDGLVVGTPLTTSTYLTVGGYGFQYVPHATDIQGIFISDFRNMRLLGALGSMKMVRAGDSLNFWNIKTYGKGRGLDLEFVDGAACPLIVGFNSTNSGGAIRLKNAFYAIFRAFNIEMFAPWDGSADRAMIVLDDTEGVGMEGITVLPFAFDSNGADCIKILGAARPRVEIRAPCRFATDSSAGWVHIRSEATLTPAVSIGRGIRWENPAGTVALNSVPVVVAQAGTIVGGRHNRTLVSAAAAGHTGNTTKTQIKTVVISSDTMGLGALKVDALWKVTPNANTKTVFVHFDGQIFTQFSAPANEQTFRTSTIIWNKTASTQIGQGASSSGFIGSTGAPVETSIDTTVNKNLSFHAQLGVGSDRVDLLAYTIQTLVPDFFA